MYIYFSKYILKKKITYNLLIYINYIVAKNLIKLKKIHIKKNNLY